MSNTIYINKLIDKNVSPLTDIHVDFPFDNDGNPKPIILVGENGTGKSTILSNIVDAFVEMAGISFSNVRYPTYPNEYQYYKAIVPFEIHLGKSFMYSYISFKNEKKIDYVLKSGDISVNEFKKQIANSTIRITWDQDKLENYKKVFCEKNTISSIWKENVICYFGPNRYEKPIWMGEKYYKAEETLHPSTNISVDGILKNPIIIQDVTYNNLQWLLDVTTDTLKSIEPIYNNIPDNSINSIHTKHNLEKILSEVLGEKVFLNLDYRNSGGSRLKILKVSDNSIVCPTFDSLSTGQIVLFNMFATIVRYADNNNILHSSNLNNITGIVVIDEIELHLHSKLQKEILPELIKMFPKIQFIITSHSPLFLLGMKDTFGEDGFCIYEMPNAEKINSEKFLEFRNAYEYLKETDMYQKEIQKAIDNLQSNSKAIIITEGSTDWKHLKAAYENLNSCGIYSDIFDNLDFEFFEYEPPESKEMTKHKLKMGNTVLTQLCENMAKLPQSVKYIFIADRDDESTNKKLSNTNKFKKWGNNVYSLILPVPSHRENTPNISIEHYYTDDEIKTEWCDTGENISYRLFLGNEFDERGIAQNIDRFCEKKNKCGSSSIAIIEGTSGEKVTCISENNGINYALPKSKFAKLILEKKAPFDNFNFESFLEIFKVIREIINDNQENDNV